MDQSRPKRRFKTYLILILVAAYPVIKLLTYDPYNSAKGVGGAPEFVGQSLSFAKSELGNPVRTFEFSIADIADSGMPRYDILNRVPDLPPETRVREVSWDKRYTFVTVWYRLTSTGEIGIDALQWDKRMTDWAENMAKPPTTQSVP